MGMGILNTKIKLNMKDSGIMMLSMDKVHFGTEISPSQKDNSNKA